MRIEELRANLVQYLLRRDGLPAVDDYFSSRPWLRFEEDDAKGEAALAVVKVVNELLSGRKIDDVHSYTFVAARRAVAAHMKTVARFQPPPGYRPGQGRPLPVDSPLTPRDDLDRSILAHYGKPMRAIAAAVGVSPSTVSTRLRKMREFSAAA